MINETTGEELTLGEHLAQLRDEVQLKIHLARADMKSLWEELETKWTLLQSQLGGLRVAKREAVADLQAVARALMNELEHGYLRIKNSLLSD